MDSSTAVHPDLDTGNRTKSYIAAAAGPSAAAGDQVVRTVDMSLHVGLRGFLASYIAVFHCLIYSKSRVNICGSAIMSFFFLLSGFACAVANTPKALATSGRSTVCWRVSTAAVLHRPDYSWPNAIMHESHHHHTTP